MIRKRRKFVLDQVHKGKNFYDILTSVKTRCSLPIDVNSIINTNPYNYYDRRTVYVYDDFNEELWRLNNFNFSHMEYLINNLIFIYPEYLLPIVKDILGILIFLEELLDDNPKYDNIRDAPIEYIRTLFNYKYYDHGCYHEYVRCLLEGKPLRFINIMEYKYSRYVFEESIIIHEGLERIYETKIDYDKLFMCDDMVLFIFNEINKIQSITELITPNNMLGHISEFGLKKTEESYF